MLVPPHHGAIELLARGAKMKECSIGSGAIVIAIHCTGGDHVAENELTIGALACGVQRSPTHLPNRDRIGSAIDDFTDAPRSIHDEQTGVSRFRTHAIACLHAAIGTVERTHGAAIAGDRYRIDPPR